MKGNHSSKHHRNGVNLEVESLQDFVVHRFRHPTNIAAKPCATKPPFCGTKNSIITGTFVDPSTTPQRKHFNSEDVTSRVCTFRMICQSCDKQKGGRKPTSYDLFGANIMTSKGFGETLAFFLL